MNARIGIIGCGNMGGGLARGILTRALPAGGGALYVYARNIAKASPLEAMGAVVCTDAKELAAFSDYILPAVKPYQMGAIIREIAPALTPQKVLVSMAAGYSLAKMREASGGVCPVARVMPNTLVTVGRGQFGLCLDDEKLGEAHKQDLYGLFSSLGQVLLLPESKINIFSALAGCGPSYIFQIADAFIEAGVTMGLPRPEATGLVFGLFAGCAVLAEESGLHPAVLREQVTSPGGQTIAGSNHLDRTGMRGHIIDAVLSAMRRGQEMEKENS